MLKDEEIRDILLRENAEFRDLYEEHQRLERRLQELTEKRYLTPDEQEEERQIKKRKLFIKDRMYALIATYRREHT